MHFLAVVEPVQGVERGHDHRVDGLVVAIERDVAVALGQALVVGEHPAVGAWFDELADAAGRVDLGNAALVLAWQRCQRDEWQLEICQHVAQLAERRPGAAAQPGGQEDDVGSLGVRCHRLPNALGVLADAFATVVQVGARAIVPVQTDVDALLTAERRLVSARSECR